MMQVAPDVTRITEHEAEPSFSLSTASPAHLPGRQWAVVPLLAFAAYAPVLSMWFIADDFGHLRYNERLPWPAPFTTIVGMQFYRPLSTSITWELFPSLFGTNALPYHILSLGLHMLAAWMLARLLTVISGEARLGWIAGALFAVYPLSTEAVGWLASQWDEWAAVCLLGRSGAIPFS